MNKISRGALMAAAVMTQLAGLGIAARTVDVSNETSMRSQTNTKADPVSQLRQVEQRSLASIVNGNGYRHSRGPRAPGPGWSNKHVQRMARKRRNVKANKRNH